MDDADHTLENLADEIFNDCLRSTKSIWTTGGRLKIEVASHQVFCSLVCGGVWSKQRGASVLARWPRVRQQIASSTYVYSTAGPGPGPTFAPLQFLPLLSSLSLSLSSCSLLSPRSTRYPYCSISILYPIMALETNPTDKKSSTDKGMSPNKSLMAPSNVEEVVEKDSTLPISFTTRSNDDDPTTSFSPTILMTHNTPALQIGDLGMVTWRDGKEKLLAVVVERRSVDYWSCNPTKRKKGSQDTSNNNNNSLQEASKADEWHYYIHYVHHDRYGKKILF